MILKCVILHKSDAISYIKNNEHIAFYVTNEIILIILFKR